MQNNNPLTEVAAIVLAGLMIIAGGLLLYTSKVDFTQATLMFGLAITIYGGNLALKAPSPTQQSQIAAIATQQSATISQMVSQQATPAPMAAEPKPQPGQMFTTQVPQPASQYIPMPQAGGAYAPPPAFDRGWSDMVPSVSSQQTLPQVPTP